MKAISTHKYTPIPFTSALAQKTVEISDQYIMPRVCVVLFQKQEVDAGPVWLTQNRTRAKRIKFSIVITNYCKSQVILAFYSSYLTKCNRLLNTRKVHFVGHV